MIRSTGVFLSTAEFTAMFMVKYKERMKEGILRLRDIPEADDDAVDLPIMKEWKTARGLLTRFKNAAAPLLNGQPAVLGKAWIETLPGNCGTPWLLEEDDYAQAHIRTRTALIITPENYSMSGVDRISLGVGVVNVVEHRVLHSEINLGPHPRTHLIVDVRRPDGEG
jgi:hypothetical protein